MYKSCTIIHYNHYIIDLFHTSTVKHPTGNQHHLPHLGLLVSFRLRRLFEILRFEAAAREALLTETLGDQTSLGGRVNSGIPTKTIEKSGETVDLMLDFMLRY